MTTQQKPLPPELRRAINQRAHALALIAETIIKNRLTAKVREAAKPSLDSMEVMLSECILTEADLLAVAITESDWVEMTYKL